MARDADGRPVPAQPVSPLLRRPDGGAMDRHLGAGREVRRLLPQAPSNCRPMPPPASGTSNCAPTRRQVASTVMRFNVEFLPEKMKLDLANKGRQLTPDSGWQIDIAGNYLYARRRQQASRRR